LRLRARLPVLLETSYLPLRLCPGLADQALDDTSLFALLEDQYGLRIQRSRQSIEAAVANKIEAGVFGIEAGSAMFLMEGVNYLEQDQPVEYFKCIYRGDCFRFELESRRDRLVSVGSVAQRVSVVVES
jgi:GntR family transcriptional regulator, N-acetylglucosamine utilization regulator